VPPALFTSDVTALGGPPTFPVSDVEGASGRGAVAAVVAVGARLVVTGAIGELVGFASTVGDVGATFDLVEALAVDEVSVDSACCGDPASVVGSPQAVSRPAQTDQWANRERVTTLGDYLTH